MTKTNRFRSGSRNPNLEVLVTPLDKERGGGFSVAIMDYANGRLVRKIIGNTNLTDDTGNDSNINKP